MATFALPLSGLEKQAKTHAILCTTGFLILLPIGALIPRWWYAHWIVQFLVAGPIILAGWALGYKTADQLRQGHFIDTHQKVGLVLLILYLAQLLLGVIAHFFKFPRIFSGRRPPQSYLHVAVGFAIFIIAAYQVHYGLYTEWAVATGGLHVVPQSAKHAWLALIVVFWVLYAAGMAFIPRQSQQERQSRQQRFKDQNTLLS